MNRVDERPVRRATTEFVRHYHYEHNHQAETTYCRIVNATTQRVEEPIACQARPAGY
jgi:hypothetical protein